ncbi:uncharacterized protein UHOD_11953 [Ustilago sp. UG-2017b]|nr:uncharacterized protein UHOD_11953 [Ustilago sp. UG-2017b]
MKVVAVVISDPWTAVDYCLRFYLYPDRWSAMNRLRTSLYASPATLLLLSLQRVPSSSSTVQGVPLAPLLPSLSYVSSFDTAPPPQDLLAGLLYTAPPPSTGDGSFDSCLSSP